MPPKRSPAGAPTEQRSPPKQIKKSEREIDESIAAMLSKGAAPDASPIKQNPASPRKPREASSSTGLLPWDSHVFEADRTRRPARGPAAHTDLFEGAAEVARRTAEPRRTTSRDAASFAESMFGPIFPDMAPVSEMAPSAPATVKGATVAEQVTKRGRGRPRKHENAELSKGTTASAPVIKRPRGRPTKRKNMPRAEKTSPSGAGSKRGPGRPKGSKNSKGGKKEPVRIFREFQDGPWTVQEWVEDDEEAPQTGPSTHLRRSERLKEKRLKQARTPEPWQQKKSLIEDKRDARIKREDKTSRKTDVFDFNEDDELALVDGKKEKKAKVKANKKVNKPRKARP